MDAQNTFYAAATDAGHGVWYSGVVYDRFCDMPVFLSGFRKKPDGEWYAQ